MSASFVDGTNKIESTTVYDDGKGNSGPQQKTTYEYTTDGKVVANSLATSTQYDAVLQQATNTSPRNSSYKQLGFQYGGAGARRVLKVVTPSQGSALTRLYLHGVQSLPLREIDQTPGKSATTTDYIYGVEGLMAIRQGSTLSFIVADHLGSTRATVVSSNPTQFQGTAFYDVFGTFDSQASSMNTKSIRYLYTGQEYDSELGMHNYRRRLYDPTGMMKRLFGRRKAPRSSSSAPSPSSLAHSPSPSPAATGPADEFTQQLQQNGAYAKYAKKSRDSARGECFEAALEISGSLTKQSIDHRIVAMVLWSDPWNDVPYTHFVVAARRGETIKIIDATAQQFPGLNASISSPRDWFEKFRGVNPYGRMQGFEEPAEALAWSEKALSTRKNPVPFMPEQKVVGSFWKNAYLNEKENFIFDLLGPIISE